MKEKGLFVIGTDTDVGKTFVTARLGGLLQERSSHVGIIKPIASGALIEADGFMHSGDADELMRLSRLPEEKRAEVNPLALPGEFSPKVAAHLAKVTIPVNDILHHINEVVTRNDYTLVEGAGGITTPINDDYNFTDFAKDTNLPALLVTDGRLGAINRVILTIAYARQHGINVIGIIVNDMDNTDAFLLESNARDMAHYTNVPVLGILPAYDGSKDPQEELAWAKQYIDMETLYKIWEA